jgi:outer membrane lipoprotein-sorting protein
MSPRLSGRRGLVLLVVVAVALAGSAAVTGAIGTFQQPTGDEVLDRVEQRYDSAETLSTTATVTVENETASERATVEFVADDQNRSRVIVERDGQAVRAGSNGTVAWYVGPNRSAASPVDALERDAEDRLERAEGEYDATGERLSPDGTPVNASNATATVLGTPTVDGTSTYEVELTHPEADGSTTLWVAQDDYRVVRAVATDGTNTTTVAVESTAFNVSIHDSTFAPPTDRVALTTADSYDSFDAAQSATDLSLPGLDATFSEATVTVRQGETIVGQRYVADGANVTLISTTATERFDRLTENATERTVDGRTVYVTSAEDRAIVAWTDDGVTTAVTLEGSTDRAVEIAGDL